jgi:hypothetical protein
LISVARFHSPSWGGGEFAFILCLSLSIKNTAGPIIVVKYYHGELREGAYRMQTL